MSYRRAWLLVDSLNKCFRDPLVASQTGGAHGGGAALTSAGVAIVRHYRAVEAAAHAAGTAHLAALEGALAPAAPAVPAAERAATTGQAPRRSVSEKRTSRPMPAS